MLIYQAGKLFGIYTCGTGSIGLYLTSEAKKVYGVESLVAAVLDAEYNAKVK